MNDKWSRAEEYLAECEKAYAEIGHAGKFAMDFVIRPARDRYNAGERTEDLHKEITGIAL